MIKEKYYKLLAFFSFILITGTVLAQTRIVKGNVKDENGQPLELVSVSEVGGKHQALTEKNGDFSIEVTPGTKFLQFVYTGKTNVVKAFEIGKPLNVQMVSTDSKLNDVVVIGYGTQKRGDLNAAASSISAKDIENLPNASIDQMMQGKAAGVTITQNSGQPGSNTSVHIRGITSFNGSEPLYVIDGVEMTGSQGGEQQTTPGSSQQETGVSPLAMLNPNDIESIDILKDAAATAIYGSRGSNGVVFITTKHGRGSAVVSYDGFVGAQKQGKLLDVMDLQQYARFESDLARAFGMQPRSEFANPAALGKGTDWQKAIFNTALETSHNVSVSGNANKTDYYLSGGYFDQDGTVTGFNFKRYTFRANLNSQVTDWLKMGGTFGGMRSNQDIGMGDNTGVIYYALLTPPDQPVYNADGTFAGPSVSSDGTVLGGLNPVQQALAKTNNLVRNQINGSVYAEIKFLKGFSLRSELNGDFHWSDNLTFNPTYSYGLTGTDPSKWQSNQTATMARRTSNSTYWSWKEILNYNHTWGKHSLNAMAGHETWYSYWDQLGFSGSGFVAGNDLKSIALATEQNPATESNSTTTMESFLARAIYSYDNKYSLTANIRRDKSSNFADGYNVAYFPGVAASWKISNEPFFKNAKGVMDNFKLRLSYGTTGNSSIPAYAYGATLHTVQTWQGVGFVASNVPNLKLQWETAIQSNLGIDFGFLDERLSGSADFYIKTSKDFLFHQPLPAFLVGGPNDYDDQTSVVSSPYVNAGNIRNTGFEFTINSRNITHDKFQWNTTLTFSHYKNKVMSLNGAPAIVQSKSLAYITLADITRTIVGQPVGEFYGYKVKGLVQTEDDLKWLAQHPQNVTGTPQTVTSDRTNANHIWYGDIMYEGNNDGAQNTKYALGSPNPDFTYGLTNTFDYKNWELNVFVYGSQGGKILNALAIQLQGLNSMYQNQLASAANYWTTENTNTDIPAPYGGLGNPNVVMSDRWLESASFLRIQNVRLGYNLPDKFAKKLALKNLKLYLSGQNLFVITGYSGLDPEIGSYNQDPTLQNVDIGRYPSPRVFTFGINAQF